MKNPITFHEDLKRPFVLDGAIGSLLQQRNVEIHEVLWSSLANIDAPEKVIEVHKEYINAGADIITTNTFRTNPLVYKKVHLPISNSEFVKKSVELAFEAKGENEKIFIAGSNPPAEDSYQKYRNITQKEIESNHETHIDMLWANEVDIVLNETQSHFDEIKVICEHCSKNKIPYIISLFVTADGKILSGESFVKVIQYITRFNPIAVGVNCVSPITYTKILSGIEGIARWGFYLNCGSGKLSDREIFEGVTPSDYINIINKKYKNESFFIGSCCGSSPAHTKAIKEFVIGKNRSKSSS